MLLVTSASFYKALLSVFLSVGPPKLAELIALVPCHKYKMLAMIVVEQYYVSCICLTSSTLISDQLLSLIPTIMLPLSLTRAACRGLVPCAQAAPLHLSPTASIQVSSPAPFQVTTSASGPSDRVTCTLIPGDGVGPEIMNSCQEVLQSMGAKVDFEEMYFSEVGMVAYTILTFLTLDPEIVFLALEKVSDFPEPL